MPQPLANFSEEFSAKIPALTLLSNLGYTFIPPADCLAMRGKSATVILPAVLRGVLAKKTFVFEGQSHTLSDNAIDKIVQDLATPAMNVGLIAANEKIYNALTYGVGVTEFINGKKAHPTISLIDWQNPENNVYHCTEEFSVENTHGTGKRIPDVVCFVNGLPWVVIEAKRPDSNRSGKLTVSAGISQSIRNQKPDEIPHLFAYSQLLLSINGHDGRYATCGTPEKFWAAWKEERIADEDITTLKNQPLSATQTQAIFNHRPDNVGAEYQSLMAGGELAITDQDRLIVALCRPDRLLEMTHLFSLFDKKIGRIIARYQQVFGIKALVERITSFIMANDLFGESEKCRVLAASNLVDLEKQLAKTFT